LASNGYIPEDGICAFYPLYPMLIRIFSVFTGGNYFWTGLILSNLFSLIAFYQFYMLVRERYGGSASRWALAFLLIFPGAIFFQLIYTESLFLMLVVIFFRRLFKNDFFGAGLCAFFLPMTRAIGIFVILPLFLWLWDNKRSLRDYTVLALPLIGYGFYFCIMAYYTGNPFEGFIAQNHYPNKPSISNIFNLGREIREIINVDRFHGGMTSAVDRFHLLLFYCL
jgi:Gpi18-like mannosyltransferase